MLLAPAFGYNHSRDAYVLRGVGRHFGPVLRPDRRANREHNRRPWHELELPGESLDAGEGVDPRSASWA